MAALSSSSSRRRRSNRIMAKRKRQLPSTPAEGQSHPNTIAGQGNLVLPQKKWYRQRAHANVFSDHNLEYPSCPAAMDWSPLYPSYFKSPNSSDSNETTSAAPARVEFVDVGCGFGGLLIDLAPLFPDKLMLGIEIRQQVSTYVQDKVTALRLAHRQQKALAAAASSSSAAPLAVASGDGSAPAVAIVDASTSIEASSPAPKRPKKEVQNKQDAEEEEEEANESAQNAELVRKAGEAPGGYENISAIRGNAMKFLPNFFERAQLSKIFFLHPDPHFKRVKHKARIISPTLLAEYAFVLRPGGILYTITDVHALHLWMAAHIEAHPLFEQIPEEDLKDDPCLNAIYTATEEGKKVKRNKGDKWVYCARRKENPAVDEEEA